MLFGLRERHTYYFIYFYSASGLGKQVVHSLIELGAFVSIFDINVELANSLVQELGKDKCYFSGSIDVTCEVCCNTQTQIYTQMY